MAWSGFQYPPPPPPPAPTAGANPPPPPPPHHSHPAASIPFWDFMYSLDPNNYGPGHGVDSANPGNNSHGVSFGPAGFEAWSGRRGFGGNWGHRGGAEHFGFVPGAWGGWGHPWGRRGCRGRRAHLGAPGDDEATGDEEMHDAAAAAAEKEKGEHDPEKEGSPNTMREGPEEEHPDPPEEVPFALPHRGRRGRGGFGGWGRGGHRHGPHPHSHHHGPRSHGPPPPYGANGAPFDLNGMMAELAGHPFAQRIRAYVDSAVAQAQAAAGGNRDGAYGNDFGEQSFMPPVDIFDTTTNWMIHIALPGAKKEDVGVNWDAEKSSLTISGVVHRPGDEELLSTMVSGERKVGMFERQVQLPPAGSDEKDEVDAEGITARMEDGVLLVVVPKVEREWTEVRKVDIE